MKDYELAQLNIARLVDTLESPTLKDFVDNLDRINSLAEASPGYVWRLQTEEGDATGFRPFGDEFIVNMSVWKDIESLHNYVYRTAHTEVMRRRKEWFSKMKETYAVLWWVPEGHRPTIEEAREKLQLLRDRGPTPDAFTFKNAYPKPTSSGALLGFDDTCPAT